MRVSEAVSPEVVDIDNDRVVIQIRYGKGARDRIVMLSSQLLGILQTRWRLARPRGNRQAGEIGIAFDVRPRMWCGFAATA